MSNLALATCMCMYILHIVCAGGGRKPLTAASSQPAAVESPLFPTTGYTESALMMDVRYKLGAALSNAGLARTGYARALLTSEKLIQPTRPCANSSSIKF